jgi:hypothetical protein
VSHPSRFEVEFAAVKLPDTGQIPAEITQAGGETLHSKVYSLAKSSVR